MSTVLKVALLASAVSLIGCAASYHQQRLGPVVQLDPGKRVYVAVPADGGYGARTAAGSGQQVAQSLAVAFSQAHIDARLAERQEDREHSLAAAQAAGAAYVADATLANWEQRATEWSGRPSRLSVTVRMLDAQSGAVLDTSVLESRSRVMSLTSTSPTSLLKGAMAGYVNGLFASPVPAQATAVGP